MEEYDDAMKKSQHDIMEIDEGAPMASTSNNSPQKPIITDRRLQSKTKAKRISPKEQQEKSEKPPIKRAKEPDHDELPIESEPIEAQGSATVESGLCCTSCKPPYHGKQLIKELKCQAGKDSASTIFGVDIQHDCDAVDFELTEVEKVQHLNRSGSYEFEQNLYQRSQLLITYNEMKGTLSIDEIFIRSQARAERKAAELNIDAQYIELGSKIVGVVGQAGIGKTTFTKMLVTNILHDEEYLGPVSFIFYLFVRKIDFSHCCTAFQFLVENALPKWQHTPECNKAIIEHIETDNRVLVVIDGLDEVSLPSGNIPKIYSIDKQTKPEIILLNLLSGAILPMARKVFTSRPEQMFNLGQPYIPEFIVQINGLGQDSQDKLGQQICGNAFKKVKNDMHYNSDLHLYCHIPIYCTMAYSYLFKKKEVTSVSPTLTSLLTSIFLDFVSASKLLERGFELKSLGHLAWIGIQRKEFIFSKDTQKAVGLDPELVKIFTNHTLLRGLSVSILEGRLLTFSHLTWQEFLAAIHLFSGQTVTQFKSLLHNHIPEVMFKCLFGLCNQNTFSQLKEVFPELSVEDWILKKTLLCKYMLKKYGSFTTVKFNHFALLWEAQDESMCAEFVSRVGCKSEMTLIGQWFPVDVVSLCYALKVVQKRFGSVTEVRAASDQEYQKCIFVSNALERFTDEIKSGIKIDTLILSKLNLQKNCWKSISSSVHLFKHLHAERCKITHEGLPNLVDNLSKLDDPITELKLGGNKLTDKGAKLLAPGISHIQRLHLDDCDITYVGVKEVVGGLKDNAQLEYLSLAGNKIGNEGAAVLAEDLHRIKGLNLLLCNITEEGVVKLAARAKTLAQQMTLLDLSENVIGRNGVSELSLCGGKIDELILRFCNLSEALEEELKDHLGASVIFQKTDK
uniref:Protein NLRC3-like n=1 Tax=Phallusia mammillata TaxID=59560 RepID=A0A6F9DMY7_9ASCI|nr:protein NLRC3-like [Phallusia mammillata]